MGGDLPYKRYGVPMAVRISSLCHLYLAPRDWTQIIELVCIVKEESPLPSELSHWPSLARLLRVIFDFYQVFLMSRNSQSAKFVFLFPGSRDSRKCVWVCLPWKGGGCDLDSHVALPGLASSGMLRQRSGQAPPLQLPGGQQAALLSFVSETRRVRAQPPHLSSPLPLNEVPEPRHFLHSAAPVEFRARRCREVGHSSEECKLFGKRTFWFQLILKT